MSAENGNESDGGRTVTLSKIIAYIVGFVVALAGLGFLTEGVGGVFILLAGLFAMPIVRRRVSEYSGVSFSRWAVVGIVIVLFVAGAFTLPSDVTNDNGTQATEAGGTDGSGGSNPTATPTPTEQSLTHEIGESFTVGSGSQAVQYRVVDVQTLDSIGSSGVGAEADGVFIVVTLEMKNVGDESFDISDRHLKVVDDQDRQYDADFEASAYASSDPRVGADGITYEQLGPGLTTTRAVIFDVPAGSEYRLKIQPVGVFSSADEHFVRLGTAESQSG